MAQDDNASLFFALIRGLWALFAAIVTAISELLAWGFQRAAFALQEARFKERDQERILRLSAKHDTATLENATLAHQKIANFPLPDDFPSPFIKRLTDTCREKLHGLPTYELCTGIGEAALELYEDEELYGISPAGIISGAIEEGRYRDKLLAHQKKLADPAVTATLFTETVINAFIAIARKLPSSAFSPKMKLPEDTNGATIPLPNFLPNLPKVVEDLILAFNHPKLIDLGLFSGLRKQLRANMEEAESLLRTLKETTRSVPSSRTLLSLISSTFKSPSPSRTNSGTRALAHRPARPRQDDVAARAWS